MIIPEPLATPCACCPYLVVDTLQLIITMEGRALSTTLDTPEFVFAPSTVSVDLIGSLFTGLVVSSFSSSIGAVTLLFAPNVVSGKNPLRSATRKDAYAPRPTTKPSAATPQSFNSLLELFFGG